MSRCGPLLGISKLGTTPGGAANAPSLAGVSLSIGRVKWSGRGTGVSDKIAQVTEDTFQGAMLVGIAGIIRIAPAVRL